MYYVDGAGYKDTVGTRASQANAAKVELESVTPELDPGEPADFEVDWFNFLSTSQGASSFVTVLPYNGDGRGTSVTGPITLAEASITAHARQGATLQLTTDESVRTLPLVTAPADAFTWIDFDQASPEQITAATALRVNLTDFVSGADSIGRLSFTMNAPDSLDNDVFAATTSGRLKGATIPLPEGEPALARVAASEVSGLIWDDANGDGFRDESEHVLSNVSVIITRQGAEIGRTQTDAHGTYRFTDLASGQVVVSVDPSTLPATIGAWQNTATPGGGSDGVSGPIELGRGGAAEGQNFGYQNLVPRIELTKTGIAPKVPLPGQPLTWEFTVRNAGNTELEDIEITDELAGLSELMYGEWPDESRPGALAPGQHVTATATSSLTQAELDASVSVNTASVKASSAVSDGPVTSTAEASIALAGVSALMIEKTVTLTGRDTPTTAVAGDTAEYRFEITNAGTLTLNDVAITDPLPGLTEPEFGSWSDPTNPGTLAPGETVTATASLELTQQHIDSGRIKNEAVATGVNPKQQLITDQDDAFLVFDNAPVIDLDKRVEVEGGGGVGSQAIYTFDISNVGHSTLSDIEFAETMPGLSEPVFEWPGTPGELAPGTTAIGTAELTITQQHIDAGTLVNTASVDAVNPVTGDHTNDTDSATVTFVQLPAISLEKQGTLNAAANTIDYTLTATNTGHVTLDSVTFTDALEGLPELTVDWPGAPETLAPGTSAVATATLSITQEHTDAGLVTNTASVSAQRVGAAPSEQPVTDTATATTVVPGTAALNLEITSLVLGRTAPVDAVAGDTVEYTYTLTNQGTLSLCDLFVVDKLMGLGPIEFGSWPGASETLAPGEQVTATAQLTLAQDHIDAGVLKNRANATGTTLSGLALAQSEAEAELTFAAQPGITLAKSVDASEGLSVGDEVRYNFTVMNSGGVTLHDVDISDELTGLSDLQFEAWPVREGTLKPGEQATASATLTLEQAHLDAGGVRNTATVTGTALGGTATHQASAEFVVQQAPGLNLTKQAGLSLTGDRVQYDITASNTGNVTLHDVVITDALPGLSALDIEWPAEPGTLLPGEQVTAQAHLVVTDTHRGTTVVNHAAATGALPDGTVVTTTASAEQAVPTIPGVIGTLVNTGTATVVAVAIAALLLLAVGLLVVSRRVSTRQRKA